MEIIMAQRMHKEPQRSVCDGSYIGKEGRKNLSLNTLVDKIGY